MSVTDDDELELEPGPSAFGRAPGTFDPLELGPTGRDLYDHTAPVAYADADHDYAWRRLMAALSELLDPIAEITRPADGRERWTNLASPTRCPPAWLPVLAQWAGVRRPDAIGDEQHLRELIGPHAPGMWRGTKAAMIAAVRRFIPEDAPDQFLYFEEFMDGEAYAIRVFTYEMHTTPDVARRIHEALAHAKPAGLFPFTYEVRVGQSYDMLNRRLPSYDAVRDHYENYDEVHRDEPLPS